MSAQRLGRLLGSLMLVAALVVASSASAELDLRTSGVEWTMPLLGSLVP